MSLIQTAHAHVEYVVEPTAADPLKGLDWAFLWSALQDPTNIGLMIGSVLIAVAIGLIAWKSGLSTKLSSRISQRAASYKLFYPWIIRLSLGISLVGNGLHSYWLSPVLDAPEWLGTVQVALGFLLLLGVAVVPIGFLVAMLYLVGLTQEWYLIGNAESLGLAVALIFFANARPGATDLLGFPWLDKMRMHALTQHISTFVPIVLRLTMGAAMIYLGLYEKLLNPHFSELVVTQYALHEYIPVSAAMWVLSVGILEIVAGLFMMLGLFTRTNAAITFAIITLTFFFFKEDVSSHITLFGILSILFAMGGGNWSVDTLIRQRLSKSSASAPVSQK